MINYPFVQAYEFDISEVADPTGTRHTPGGSFAFNQILASGCSVADPNFPATTSGYLIFENVRFNSNDIPTHIESKVAAIIYKIVSPSTTGSFISNMRLYIAEDSALLAGVNLDANEPARIQFTNSGIWQPNALLPSGQGTFLTTTVPSVANFKRQDGFHGLEGDADNQVSEYLYMNLLVPAGFPLGSFGNGEFNSCGSGTLRIGMVFDYYTL